VHCKSHVDYIGGRAFRDPFAFLLFQTSPGGAVPSCHVRDLVREYRRWRPAASGGMQCGSAVDTRPSTETRVPLPAILPELVGVADGMRAMLLPFDKDHNVEPVLWSWAPSRDAHCWTSSLCVETSTASTLCGRWENAIVRNVAACCKLHRVHLVVNCTPLAGEPGRGVMRLQLIS